MLPARYRPLLLLLLLLLLPFVMITVAVIVAGSRIVVFQRHCRGLASLGGNFSPELIHKHPGGLLRSHAAIIGASCLPPPPLLPLLLLLPPLLLPPRPRSPLPPPPPPPPLCSCCRLAAKLTRNPAAVTASLPRPCRRLLATTATTPASRGHESVVESRLALQRHRPPRRSVAATADDNDEEDDRLASSSSSSSASSSVVVIAPAVAIICCCCCCCCCCCDASYPSCVSCSSFRCFFFSFRRRFLSSSRSSSPRRIRSRSPRRGRLPSRRRLCRLRRAGERVRRRRCERVHSRVGVCEGRRRRRAVRGGCGGDRGRGRVHPALAPKGTTRTRTTRRKTTTTTTRTRRRRRRKTIANLPRRRRCRPPAARRRAASAAKVLFLRRTIARSPSMDAADVLDLGRHGRIRADSVRNLRLMANRSQTRKESGEGWIYLLFGFSLYYCEGGRRGGDAGVARVLPSASRLRLKEIAWSRGSDSESLQLFFGIFFTTFATAVQQLY